MYLIACVSKDSLNLLIKQNYSNEDSLRGSVLNLLLHLKAGSLIKVGEKVQGKMERLNLR